MAGFYGRRTPNVSQYIANLNAINPSSQDVATQHDDSYGLEDDLAVFTNAEFFDFDLGDGIEQPPISYDPSHEERARREHASAHKNGHKIDFINENYTFPSLPPFIATTQATSIESSYRPPQAFATTTPPSPFIYPAPPSITTNINPSNHVPLMSPTTMTNPSTPTSPSPSHFAAEEDKRRRNTAASARFRVKKKQREQALERTAKELSDKAKELEKRVGQLETENEWLRGLVVERNGGAGLDAMVKDREAVAEKNRSEKERKKGVGTSTVEAA